MGNSSPQGSSDNSDIVVEERNNFDPYRNIPVIIRTNSTDWCKRRIDIVEGCNGSNCPGNRNQNTYKDYLMSYQDAYRIYHVNRDKLLEPGWTTFYWYGHCSKDANEKYNGSEIYTGLYDVYFCNPSNYPVNRGILLVYYRKLVSNLRCNPYRIVPTYDEVTTISYDTTADAHITIKIYDPNGNPFATPLSHAYREANHHTETWYGMTGDPNLSTSRYTLTEGVYRVEVIVDETNEKIEGSITVYAGKDDDE